MKKTLFALPLMALFFFFANSASAQINELKLENNSNCPVTVQVSLNDFNCNSYCRSNQVTVPALTLITIPLNCLTEEKAGTVQVRLMDNQSNVVVGTGCGLPASATYLDCTSQTRTLSMIGNNAAVVN